MRDLNSDVIAALNEDQVFLAMLGEFDFASGIQNLWAGPEGHVIEYDSKQWYALGDIGQIDKISEGQGLADSRTTVSLYLNSESIDVVDVEDSRGRRVTITLLLMSNQGEVIGPINFVMTMGKVGIIATATVGEEGQKVVNEQIFLELLNETATLGQSHYQRMTYEAGLRIDNTDHGLEFVSDPDAMNLGLGIRPSPRDRSPRDRSRR